MPLDPGFLSLLSQTATLNRAGAADQWGNETYGASETIKCFLDGLLRTLPSNEDQEQAPSSPEATGKVITDAVGIAVRDKITFGSTVTHVQEASTFRDETGIDLYQELTVSTTAKG